MAYSELINMPIPELLEWLDRANKIEKEINARYEAEMRKRK